MNRNSAMAVILAGGILPRDSVVQLVQQGQLPEEVLELYSSNPVPEDKDGRRKWAERLRELLGSQEIELMKETVLDVPEEAVSVWVYPDEQSLRDVDRSEAKCIPALINESGKFMFGAEDLDNDLIKEGAGIEFKMAGIRSLYRIKEVEPLYQGEDLQFVVCDVHPLLP